MKVILNKADDRNSICAVERDEDLECVLWGREVGERGALCAVARTVNCWSYSPIFVVFFRRRPARTAVAEGTSARLPLGSKLSLQVLWTGALDWPGEERSEGACKLEPLWRLRCQKSGLSVRPGHLHSRLGFLNSGRQDGVDL